MRRACLASVGLYFYTTVFCMRTSKSQILFIHPVVLWFAGVVKRTRDARAHALHADGRHAGAAHGRRRHADAQWTLVQR